MSERKKDYLVRMNKQPEIKAKLNQHGMLKKCMFSVDDPAVDCNINEWVNVIGVRKNSKGKWCWVVKNES